MVSNSIFQGIGSAVESSNQERMEINKTYWNDQSTSYRLVLLKKCKDRIHRFLDSYQDEPHCECCLHISKNNICPGCGYDKR
jgi:hypothetical protein